MFLRGTSLILELLEKYSKVSGHSFTVETVVLEAYHNALVSLLNVPCTFPNVWSLNVFERYVFDP